MLASALNSARAVHLQRLTSYGVTFHSYTEPHLATDNELVRNILLALLSSLAKVEAQKISERTKAGMGQRAALRQDRGAGGQTPFGPQEVETMSRGGHHRAGP